MKFINVEDEMEKYVNSLEYEGDLDDAVDEFVSQKSNSDLVYELLQDAVTDLAPDLLWSNPERFAELLREVIDPYIRDKVEDEVQHIRREQLKGNPDYDPRY